MPSSAGHDTSACVATTQADEVVVEGSSFKELVNGASVGISSSDEVEIAGEEVGCEGMEVVTIAELTMIELLAGEIKVLEAGTADG